MIFGQGSFTNDATATPEQVARKRAYLAAMMPRFGSARYVGEGIGQAATGFMIGRQNKKLDGQEAAGRKSADAMFSGLIGQGSTAPGAFTVLGSAPMDGPPMPPPDPNSPHALGNDAMAAIGKPAMSTAPDAASIKAGLVARGLPEHVADGFVMNMQDESGLNPGINEISPLVPGSRGGFGLYQLTGPRRVAYEQFAAERGVPVDDVDAQLDFLMTELQGPEASAAQAILSTKSPGEAGAAIVNKFLRPSPEHRASREARYLSGATPSYGAQDIPTDQLASALANPWLAPEQRAMLATMYDQQVQAGDPMAQLELEQKALEVEAMRNPQAQMPEEITTRMLLMEQAGLDPQSPEGQHYMLTGELPSAAGENMPADFQSLKLRADAAGLVEGTPEYQDFMRQGAGAGAPAAFVSLDMQARAAGFEPGTPEYQEFMATRGTGLQAQAKVEGTAAGEAVTGLGTAVAKSQQAIDLIDQIANDPALPSITGMIQGNLPPMISGGQEGVDLNVKLGQLQGKVFLETFESLKGGGAITEVEGTKAEQAIARLNRAQSEGAIKEALAELRGIVESGMNRAKARAEAASAPPSSAKKRMRFNPETGMVE